MKTTAQVFNKFTKRAQDFANQLGRPNADFNSVQGGLDELRGEVEKFALYDNKSNEMLAELEELELLLDKMYTLVVNKTYVV